MTPVQTITHKKYTIEIYSDDMSENPRESWDQLSQMVCFHKRYNLGDEHEYSSDDFNNWNHLKRQLKKDGALFIKPLYMYDHSGITIKTTPFSCQWDSGQIGFVFTTQDKINEFFDEADDEKIEKCILSDVETYDHYLTGEVYGFITKDKDDNEIDSCWGFYGYDFENNGLLETAKGNIE